MRRGAIDRRQRQHRSELARRGFGLVALHGEPPEPRVRGGVERIDRDDALVNRAQLRRIVNARVSEQLRQLASRFDIVEIGTDQRLQLRNRARPILLLERDLRHLRVRALLPLRDRDQRGPLDRVLPMFSTGLTVEHKIEF